MITNPISDNTLNNTAQETIEQLQRKEIENLRQHLYALDDENRELDALPANKAKKLLIATVVYSFVFTLFAAKTQPAIIADLVSFGGGIKELFLFLFKSALSISDFVSGRVHNIPYIWIATVLSVVAYIIVFGVIFMLTLTVLISIGWGLYDAYTSYLSDAITVGFTFVTLAACVYLSEWLKAFLPINLVTLFIIVNGIYIIARKILSKRAKTYLEQDINSIVIPKEDERSVGDEAEAEKDICDARKD